MFSACTRAPEGPARYAFLPFDNLTGDAALDWLARAAPRIAAAEIAGTAHTASTVGDAYLERANRFVHGYFTRQGGGLRLNVEVEDAATHKMIEVRGFEGAALTSVTALAKALDPAAGEFSSSNAEAVEAWGKGDFEKAVAVDPAFGAAWLSLMEEKARTGDNAGALAVADQALAHPMKVEVDGLRIALARATLAGDARAEHDALVKLTAKVADPALLENLGALETKAREFALAEGDYKKILAAEPENPDAMNLLGYAQGFQGKVSDAEATFAAYRKLPGQEANSYDSLGEVYFINGKFADAEKAFVKAHEVNAAFLSGGDLRKAAYAHWLGGDLPGADALFQRFLEFKKKLRDPSVEWEQAAWLYSTGRTEPALAMLGKMRSPQSVVQAKVWRGEVKLPSDAAEWKKAYEAVNPSADGLFRTLYAEALAAEGNREEAKKLAARWPLPDNAGDAVLQSLVFPKFIALRRMLNL